MLLVRFRVSDTSGTTLGWTTPRNQCARARGRALVRSRVSSEILISRTVDRRSLTTGDANVPNEAGEEGRHQATPPMHAANRRLVERHARETKASAELIYGSPLTKSRTGIRFPSMVKDEHSA